MVVATTLSTRRPVREVRPVRVNTQNFSSAITEHLLCCENKYRVYWAYVSDSKCEFGDDTLAGDIDISIHFQLELQITARNVYS